MHAAFLAALVLASSATAQVRQTMVNEDGDSVVVQQTTDVNGLPVLSTILTIPGGAAADTGTGTSTGVRTTTGATTTALLPTTTGTRTTTSLPLDDEETTLATTTTRKAAGGQNGGQGQPQGVQGPPTTTYPPMTATTYDINGQEYTWRNSFVVPAQATAQVPEGTRQDGSAYLASVGAAQSAALSTYNAGGGTGVPSSAASSLISDGGLAGWMAMFVGMVTAGYGVYLM
ncbi:uncharacterized protein CcaverHIS019_0209820 [Cutaneotrichosporon cavernicola]|uniref:Uncharacterized protein n=1 Tax=Cutaneotrichosporon cavernicola TaxID=279322 RepID=A0AA48I865_9TREE|nr:uncharacterized protein CcaverHIS019_0209820 [Cutaneotrichosporon cavernicola]BEI89620.1 hypothetical protein CcaverHIS019_0209820 [Cutaneotrichosporon cavernicola]BEI97392.1 hypothetical protein CcaverHIS631_0209810 [Cutaneotrichosporon cavernicola]BEJ05169.1 hypothetical protein CcaverHIS641_0209860 [Cutaneotrichosporon cavernicola]